MLFLRFLTPEAITALIGPDSTCFSQIIVEVNGASILMGTSKDHFKTVNIIGMDFLMPRK